MRYVIGVDGGPGGTTAVLADESGCLLGIGQGGSVHIDTDAAGVERTRRAIRDAISGAISMAELENARIAAACVAIAGDPEEIEGVCVPVVPADYVFIGNQSKVALNTVTLGSPGVVVIADTVSQAFGMNSLKQTYATGGWNQPQGDEGSCYWIALRALNACCRSKDGVGPTTQILPLALQHLEADALQTLLRRFQRGDGIRSEVTALVEMVGLAAAQGDAVSKKLLRESGKELALSACAILVHLDMNENMVPVGTVGAVFRVGRLVLKAFRETVHKAAPRCEIISPRVPVCVGAAIAGLEEIGVDFQNDARNVVIGSLATLRL